MVERTQSPEYDLFISYANEDREWVEGFLFDALSQAKITYHMEAAFELGKPRLLAFEEAVQQSKRILLVLSPAYLMEGHTLFIDLLAEQYGLETGTWPVIPLILKPVEKLPLRLRILNPLDMTDRYERESALQRLATALQQPIAPPTPVPDAPYPGMRSFTDTQEDSRYFFGRSREIGDLINLLHSNQFLVLIGPSGSGKSSLARGQLAPDYAGVVFLASERG